MRGIKEVEEAINHRMAVRFEMLTKEYLEALHAEGIPCPVEMSIPIPVFNAGKRLVDFMRGEPLNFHPKKFAMGTPDDETLTIRPGKRYCWEKFGWEE